jgi:hypothetical protein
MCMVLRSPVIFLISEGKNKMYLFAMALTEVRRVFSLFSKYMRKTASVV